MLSTLCIPVHTYRYLEGKEPNGLAVLTGDDDLLMLDVNMKELYRSTDTYIT